MRGNPPPRVDLLAGADVIRGVDLIDLDRAAELLAGLRPRFVCFVGALPCPARAFLYRLWRVVY